MVLFGRTVDSRHSLSTMPARTEPSLANTSNNTTAIDKLWRRSLKNTGAFLLFMFLAGAAMLSHNPSSAQENTGSKPALSNINSNLNLTVSQQSSTTSQRTNNSEPATQHTSAQTQTNVANQNKSSQTTVTVNGQILPVPVDGTVHKVVNTGNGTTSIDVSSSSTSTSDSSSSSYTNTRVNVMSTDYSAEQNFSQSYGTGGGAN